ncbi:uncharacterized protein LOC113463581 [Phoenix dactylifera]|uniref:Uncharacterized protein LOC113463581 n=1 Tax=Phoenix dactylifera TaxID=42345 RepID=A0A8B9ANH3_PHODC|nr:uncharacterized protein LOC113463581 [Phoenix dactylifera]
MWDIFVSSWSEKAQGVDAGGRRHGRLREVETGRPSNYSNPFLDPIPNLEWLRGLRLWNWIACISRWMVVVGVERVGSGSYGGAPQGRGVEATGRRRRLPTLPHRPMPSVPRWRRSSGRCQRISRKDDDNQGTLDEVRAKLQLRQERATKRERAIAYSFSQQQWRPT